MSGLECWRISNETLLWLAAFRRREVKVDGWRRGAGKGAIFKKKIEGMCQTWRGRVEA